MIETARKIRGEFVQGAPLGGHGFAQRAQQAVAELVEIEKPHYFADHGQRTPLQCYGNLLNAT